MSDEEPVSALVILKERKPAGPGGGSIGDAHSTAVARFEAINRVHTILSLLGFEPGTYYGVSLSIHACPSVFYEAFGVEVVRMDGGGFGFHETKEAVACTRSLPIERIPAKLRDDVETIAFSPMPEIGNAGFYSI